METKPPPAAPSYWRGEQGGRASLQDPARLVLRTLNDQGPPQADTLSGLTGPLVGWLPPFWPTRLHQIGPGVVLETTTLSALAAADQGVRTRRAQ
ncbi:hypothetical protein MTO96_049649 [Rhipicephalus appendiculatus]